MGTLWNVTNAPSSMNRVGASIARDAVSGGFSVRARRRSRDVVRHVPNAGVAPIQRLVLVGSSEDGRPSLEIRAKLIASGMHPSPQVVRGDRENDVLALTKASDLVLVDRKKPLPFIVPYLGRTARGLLRKSDAPLLVVAGMPQATYRRVVVATDLKTDIARALTAAAVIAPDASLTLLHAYHALFDGKLQWAGVPQADIAAYRADAQRDAALGMATLLDRHPAMHPSRTLLRYGWPVPGVLRAAAEVQADLIVVVRNTQSWWADVLGASVSLELAERANRDVLIVRAAVSDAPPKPTKTGRASE